jgi:methylmalonyl-CoA epimerase
MSIKRIDHIAIVVPNIEEALAFYQDTLGLQLTHIEEVADQEVIVAFLPAGDSEIELVEPINNTSGIARYMSKHGPGIHHICIEVDDIETALAQLKGHGVELIDEEPAIGSGGKKIAFVHPHSAFGVLFELYETTPEEPERRAAILEGLQDRLDVERKAMAAGVSAFLRTLRRTVRAGSAPGIVIKGHHHSEPE